MRREFCRCAGQMARPMYKVGQEIVGISVTQQWPGGSSPDTIAGLLVVNPA